MDDREPLRPASPELTEYRLRKVENDAEECACEALKARVTALEEGQKRTEKKLDSILGWLKGVFGSLVVALIMLLINMLAGHPANHP